MRMKNFMLVLFTIIFSVLFTQCEKKYGKLNRDVDSDAPAWAGGNTDANDHINRNDNSGTKRGGDYGDLYVLLRDDNGVPEMTPIGDEWYVQPIDANGNTLDLDEEGELIDPEAATEVEFGRLNIVRSPESVLDQAFEEAMKVIDAGDNFTLDFCGRLTIWNNGVITKTIDSPRENMAIYKYLMNNMFEETAENGYNNRLGFLGEPPYNFDALTLAASCIAAGSDKTGTLTKDEVVYIDGFLGCIGLNPIENLHEYDFNHNVKNYYNFGDCDGLGTEFVYDRKLTYQNRYIQFLAWGTDYYPVDENGNSNSPHIFSIWEYMEFNGLYTSMWQEGKDYKRLEGFALAADDAVQVLDFVHGDSNVLFLPNYTP